MIKIIANWKMYLTIRQSRELAAQVKQWWQEAKCPNVELVICPSDVAMRDVADHLSGSTVQLGAQHLSLSPTLGAFTGQSSAQQLREAGASHVLLGHSELRQFFHVTDSMIRQQVAVAAKQRLHPVICVGETLAEREHGRTDSVVVSQLHAVLEGVTWPSNGLSVAYEPRWAIGTQKPVDPKEAGRVLDLIKHTLREFFGDLRAQDASVLYGGSVDEKNAKDFLAQETVSGLLIGSASTKPEVLHCIVEQLQADYCKR
jgi:triosephosphate isomerase